MTDLAADAPIDVDAPVQDVLLREVADVVARTQTEISTLDELWEHEWPVGVDRAYRPQRLDPVAASLPNLTVAAQRTRRAIDIGIAVVALLLLLPVMLLLAVAVKLSSPGAVIFKQLRVGVGGREFQMCKFRSMAEGTDSALLRDEAARREYETNGFKLAADDPRITTLGRFMRKTSLDELPQLWNVLRGDMSIVGIRPLLARELAMRPVRDQMLIKMLRPGMTGLWQVEGRSNVTIDDRYELDRRYVEEWSLVGDLSIIARTPIALLRVSDSR